MPTSEPTVSSWKLNPFLHVDGDRIYNPLTDRTITLSDASSAPLREFIDNGSPEDELERDGWIVRETADLSTHYRLKIVSLELTTTCNQKCYFCPVSIAPRSDHQMSEELFARILEQLIPITSIEGVFLQSYNEPSLDRHFVDHCRAVHDAGLPVAVLSNGSGFTPAVVDALIASAPLRYLCINLSTIDRARYAADRGGDHLPAVLRNLDYLKGKPLAQQMNLAVLGRGDDLHKSDFALIRERFAGSRFDVQSHLVMDRAGWLSIGMKPPTPLKGLAGCDNIGSRPLQHLHITPHGKCVLCCEDYDERYVIGDLTTSSVAEVLHGPEVARLRRWAYGVEEAPDDFICRNCVFARSR